MNASDIPRNRLYDDLAGLFPLVTPHTGYAGEAADYREALGQYLGDGRQRILDLGTGGGHLLHYVAGGHDAKAVDISERMLEHATRLNPDVVHHCGDMRTVRLGRTFDVVILHDAVSYLLTERDLAAAFATAAAHLRKDGLVILAPDYYRETFSGPEVDTVTNTDDRTVLTYVEYRHDPDPSDSTIETIMTYYIQTGDRLCIEMDRHVTGLFPRATWIRLLENAGFTVGEWQCSHGDAAGRCLLVGTLQ